MISKMSAGADHHEAIAGRHADSSEPNDQETREFEKLSRNSGVVAGNEEVVLSIPFSYLAKFR
jgi:hypothetical protein